MYIPRLRAAASFLILLAIVAAHPTSSNSTILAPNQQPRCTNVSPRSPVLLKQECRDALTNFLRYYQAQTDYLITRNRSHDEDIDYIVVPLFVDVGNCVIIYDLPPPITEDPIFHIATLLHYTTSIINDCVERADTTFDGGFRIAPAVDPPGDYLSILIGPTRPGGDDVGVNRGVMGHGIEAVETL